jgi:predicted Rossmann-fold nucleotide-binding protein
VILDQWHVQLGDDVTQFMEQAIVDAEFVLLVCTEMFAQKSHARRSGVGYEQAIVTSELLNTQPPRGRFVCVLREGLPSVAIPRYLQSRLYVDLRNDDQYKAGLDQLLVHLFRKYPMARPNEPVQVSNLPAVAERQHSKPQSWVLVAGTGVESAFTAQLRHVSEQLGTQLGAAGFGVVTGGWPGVDESVARAFAKQVLDGGGALEDRLIQMVVEDDDPAFSAGQLVFVKRGEPEWLEPIRRANAVVLVGGVGGTLKTGALALDMSKPVLPLAETGGDARTLYMNMLRSWERFSRMPFSQAQFQTLARPELAGVIACISLLNQLPKYESPLP